MQDDYGFPHIPLNRLRELKHHAEMVAVAVVGGSFTGSDLWRIYVGLEVNALLASHWYGELDKAKNYNPSSGDDCPLCFYDEGELVASCGYHKKIDLLLKTVEKLANHVEENRTESQRDSE